MAARPISPGTQQRVDLAELPIALVAGLGLALSVLFLFAMPFAGKMAATRDFVSFWATGQQLVHRGNPYDPGAISALEHAAGLNVPAILIMRNPPWALLLVLPLGFLGVRIAAILWSLLLLFCLLISVHWVRRMYGSPPNRIHWLGLGFTPALLCLTMGQTSLFALLGLVAFLRFHSHRPILAGAALWLCMLKPHLFLAFGVVLLAWVVVARGYRVLAGAAAALALASAVSYLADPAAWPDYIQLMRSPAVENDFIPCLSHAIRFWLMPRAIWLQYLPAAISCVWALIYFWRRRAAWDWLRNGSILVLVSLLAAPYCWFYDQCLAIPALMDGAYAARSRIPLVVAAVLILAMDIEICFFRVASPMYLWTVPVWLAWFLFARASATRQSSPSPQ